MIRNDGKGAAFDDNARSDEAGRAVDIAVERAVAERDALAAKLARAKKALEPFAKAAAYAVATGGDPSESCSRADYTAARAAHYDLCK